MNRTSVIVHKSLVDTLPEEVKGHLKYYFKGLALAGEYYYPVPDPASDLQELGGMTMEQVKQCPFPMPLTVGQVMNPTFREWTEPVNAADAHLYTGPVEVWRQNFEYVDRWVVPDILEYKRLYEKVAALKHELVPLTKWAPGETGDAIRKLEPTLEEALEKWYGGTFASKVEAYIQLAQDEVRRKRQRRS